MMAFNELESKVFVLIEIVQALEKKISVIESIARKQGIELKSENVEADTCTIN
jgi:hypothetical protein